VRGLHTAVTAHYTRPANTPCWSTEGGPPPQALLDSLLAAVAREHARKEEAALRCRLQWRQPLTVELV
jgi:hypothetical protein